MMFLWILLAINALVLGWAGLIGLRRWREERHFSPSARLSLTK